MENLEKAVLKAINFHINLLIDTEEVVQQINESTYQNTKNENIENMIITKQNQISKISNFKRTLYEDWKSDYITKEEYLEYKQKYEQDIGKIKEIMANLDRQKEKQEEIINGNGLWIENFKSHKNITELDRDIITELVDYIEVHENKKITIHFKFMDEIDQILEYIEDENKASIFERVKEA